MAFQRSPARKAIQPERSSMRISSASRDPSSMASTSDSRRISARGGASLATAYSNATNDDPDSPPGATSTQYTRLS